MSAPGTTLRIGNMSASRGDRPTAMSELLAAGALDVLAVDMLSDEQMLQLAADREAGGVGFEAALLEQLSGCLDRIGGDGVRIVTNAGALDPEGLAREVAARGRAAGRDLAVAWVDGGVVDPSSVAGTEGAAVAVVRHGAFGIALALEAGAEIVLTGRVSREALVVGAAAAHHRWTPAYLDALAGAVAVGHVLSGGPGATGVSGASTDVTRAADPVAAGYPVAEIAGDGSCVVTKHPSALGSVTVGTVTDQLLDGVTGARYAAPDVVLRLDSLRVVQEGTDRVRISGARGEAPSVAVPVVGLFRDGGTIRRATGRIAWPACGHTVTLPGGERRSIGAPADTADTGDGHVADSRPVRSAPGGAPTVAPLGSVAGVRQGIVGDAINLALWTWDESAYDWLRSEFTPDRLAEVLPEYDGVELERFDLPNLRAVNIVVRMGDGCLPGPGLSRTLAAVRLEIPAELLEVDP